MGMIYGIGHMGNGKHNTKHKAYSTWSGMLSRCYSPKSNRYHRYGLLGVTVCKSWHNFQNFAKWYEDNYIEGFQLDKDILAKKNKSYNPKYCVFVPRYINNLLTTSNKIRGKYPTGVYINDRGKYRAKMKKYSKTVSLGAYNTPEEAFLVYKQHKEAHIKVVAKESYEKGEIGLDVYQALMQYSVIPYPE